MIGQLTGSLERITRHGTLIMRVGDVGYEIHTPASVLSRLPTKETVTLLTHLVVREDVLALYGFSKEEDLSFFEMLLGVAGIGPKSALGILNLADVETLRSAIAAGNARYLTKVAGIGKKTAERIVVELSEKVGDIARKETAEGLRDEAEALEALESLGYTREESRTALKRAPAGAKNISDRVREALKALSLPQS